MRYRTTLATASAVSLFIGGPFAFKKNIPGESEIEHYNSPSGESAPMKYDGSNRAGVASPRTMDMVAVSHSMHPGDSEKYSALGFRIGVNYVIYCMKH